MRKIALAAFGMMTAMPALAQTAPETAPAPAPAPPQPPEAEEEEPADIVVTGSRSSLPGAVIGDIPPEEQLTPADIRSYGVSSVNDLLTELGPQTRSGVGGAPVVLLNGRRIANFSEIRDIPTEAIQRVDILPEEVALKYGYRADQKVVNIVLRRRFRAVTVEAADRVPTEGGTNNAQGELDVLQINRGGRLNLHLSYQDTAPLSEAERGIVQQPSSFAVGGNVLGLSGGAIDPALGGATIAGVPRLNPTLSDFSATAGLANVSDQGPYRTLIPGSHTASANLVYARTIFGNVAATLNGRLEQTGSRSAFGLPTAALLLPAGNPYSPFANDVTVARAFDGVTPLERSASTLTSHLGTTLGGDAGKWRWTLTGTYDRVESETFTDTGLDVTDFQARLIAGDPLANPFGAFPLIGSTGNVGRSTSSEAEIQSLASGPVLALPAGDVSTTIRIGADTSDFSSRSLRAGIAQAGDVSRDTASGQVNVDVPITSRSRDVLAWAGNFSLNGNIGADRLSDFGTQIAYGYGANWSPIAGIRVIASVANRDEAPSAAQLGNPLLITPNTRVFDYVAGQTVNVTTISGGTRSLRADNRNVQKVGVTLKPWAATDLTIIGNYTRTRIDDPIAAFPTPTAPIEAAFPDRFTRVDGALVRLDTRPINYARSENSQFRYGFNFSKPLKSKVQRELEAFRAGTGPNPFAGMTFPGRGRRGEARGGSRDGAAAQAEAPAGGAATPAPAGDAQAADRPADGRGGGGRGGFGGGGFGGRGGGGGGGRLQFALYHTIHLTDRVDVVDGGPTLDLLRGDAIGQSGGQPRHEVEGQAGYTNNGLGARLSANWQSGTTVQAGSARNPQTLNFSDLATLNLRLFADFGGRLEWVKAHPWLRGTRVTLSFNNLTNERQRVTDANGVTPISYQPGYLDPLGRSVRLSLRKLFF